MASETPEQKLIDTCAAYLRSTYGEELLDYDIQGNEVEDGDGVLSMECTVRAGTSTSRWHKTFTFRGGQVANMAWRQLG